MNYDANLASFYRLFPGELVATRRGSPLIVGIRSEEGIDTDHIPVQYRSVEQ